MRIFKPEHYVEKLKSVATFTTMKRGKDPQRVWESGVEAPVMSLAP
jgi:hypothetical protein